MDANAYLSSLGIEVTEAAQAAIGRLALAGEFVLGGEPYEFKFSRGMTIQVKTSAGRLPTVPSWVSEMLPLNYDLAMEIQGFRRLLAQRFHDKESPDANKAWLREYLPVDELAVQAVYGYFAETVSG